MKTLVIIRHAKSDQTMMGKDIERPLNARGNRDAPVMAARLHEKLPNIEAFVSSPAVRTTQTATYFVTQFGRPVADIQFLPALYHGSSAAIQHAVFGLADDINVACFFLHNPGVTEFVNDMLPKSAIDNMPTCGVFAFTIAADSWIDLGSAKKALLFFDHPKMGG